MRATVKALADPIRVGTDRLDAIDGPAIFAANHHSHLDAPLLLTSIPEPWRHKIVVGAAADYFFRNRVTSAALGAGHRRLPDRAVEGQPPVGRPGGRAAGRRVEPADLPRGRPLPRRLGPGPPRRRRLPVRPHRRARRARAHRGHRTASSPRATSGPGPARPRSPSARPLCRWRARTPPASPPASRPPSPTLADEAGTDWWTSRRRAAAGTTPSLTGPGTSSGAGPGPSATAKGRLAVARAPPAGPSCRCTTWSSSAAGRAGRSSPPGCREDPARRVVLLEEGADDRAYDERVRDPRRCLELFGGGGHGEPFTMTAATPDRHGAGPGSGGTSAVNFLAAVRGKPADYDGWGLDGWRGTTSAAVRAGRGACSACAGGTGALARRRGVRRRRARRRWCCRRPATRTATGAR